MNCQARQSRWLLIKVDEQNRLNNLFIHKWPAAHGLSITMEIVGAKKTINSCDTIKSNENDKQLQISVLAILAAHTALVGCRYILIFGSLIMLMFSSPPKTFRPH